MASSNLKRKCIFLSKVGIAHEKNQIKLKGKLKVETVGHLPLLKQEFERYFPDLSETELLKWKMTRNHLPFWKFSLAQICLNNNILFKDLQEVFSEIKCNSNTKNNFEAVTE